MLLRLYVLYVVAMMPIPGYQDDTGPGVGSSGLEPASYCPVRDY